MSGYGSTLVTLIDVIRHALLNYPEIVQAYLAVYLQHAHKEPTEEDENDHNQSFHEFLRGTDFLVDTIGPRDFEPGLYARWSPPGPWSSSHIIKVDESLLDATVHRHEPNLKFLFVVCVVHEMAHAYSYFVRQRRRFGSHSSLCTSVDCSVGVRRDIVKAQSRGRPSTLR